MGGETRLELQHTIFESSYPAKGAYEKQPFMVCVNVTRATGYIHATPLRLRGWWIQWSRACHCSPRMGYNYHVPSIAVMATTNGKVAIDVTLMQLGVAPFYYDLGLALSCPTMPKAVVGGVNTMTENGESRIFSFNVPANAACLSFLSLTLDSSYAYPNRPIKFAQGNGLLNFRLPLPGDTTFQDEYPTYPTSAPTVQPQDRNNPRNSPFGGLFSGFFGQLWRFLFPIND